MIENERLLKQKQPIEELISELKAKSIKLWIEDEFLRYKAPKGIITAEILKEIAERKEEIKNYIMSFDVGNPFEKPTPKIDTEEYDALSAAQKRMYLLSKMNSVGMMENQIAVDQQQTSSQLEAVHQENSLNDNQIQVDKKEIDMAAGEVAQYPVSKELKVVMQRDITTYLHRSLPLCAILVYDKYLPWYYNNFIQVFSYTDSNGNVELNYLEGRDCYIEIVDVVCLGYHLLKNEKSILEFIIEKINMGYYLVMNVDEFYLPNKGEYHKNHFVHSSLIYGYDNNTKCLKAIGFNQERLFTELTFDYSEFTDAYENGKIHYKKDAPWCDWSAVQLIRPKSFEGEFPFIITRFINELEEYLFSKSDLRRLYSFEYQPEQVEFGFKIYDVFVKNLHNLLDGNMTIDYRAAHLLSEHKKCLYDRIGYVISKYQLSGEITELHKQYMEIVKRWNNIRLKYLSQFLKDIDFMNNSQKQKYLIHNVINEINEVKEMEYSILEKIIEELKLNKEH